jgi:REP element-mobilizing transposase RayT
MGRPELSGHFYWLQTRVAGILSPMANTYSQIYIQVVFAVQGRENLIPTAQKEELQKYITGIVRGCDQKLLAVHCMPDHTHMLVGLKPAMALSDLVKEVKAASSRFIKTKRWVAGRFAWQEGFGAFSYGHSQIGQVIGYITRQPEHHARTTFGQEYVRFLKKFEVEHDDRFVFKDVSL